MAKCTQCCGQGRYATGTSTEMRTCPVCKGSGDAQPVVHLAGNQIIVGNYVVQRCLLCGALLDEHNAQDVMIATTGRTGPVAAPPGFVVGGLYEVDGNRTSLVAETTSPVFESDLDLPDNCCIRHHHED